MVLPLVLALLQVNSAAHRLAFCLSIKSPILGMRHAIKSLLVRDQARRTQGLLRQHPEAPDGVPIRAAQFSQSSACFRRARVRSEAHEDTCSRGVPRRPTQ